MARRPSVRYWPTRKAYCCWFKGKQYMLAEGADDYPDGPTHHAALSKCGQITIFPAATTAGDSNPLRVVVELYFRHCIAVKSPETTAVIRRHLAAFVDAVDPEGIVPVSTLQPYKVNAWLDDMRQPRKIRKDRRVTRWTSGTVRLVIIIIKACLNWAVREGLITANPLRNLSAPGARSRGREALTGRTPEERARNHARIVQAAPKSFKPFITCLEATGARPGELAKATAADFDPQLGAIVYHGDTV